VVGIHSPRPIKSLKLLVDTAAGRKQRRSRKSVAFPRTGLCPERYHVRDLNLRLRGQFHREEADQADALREEAA